MEMDGKEERDGGGRRRKTANREKRGVMEVKMSERGEGRASDGVMTFLTPENENINVTLMTTEEEKGGLRGRGKAGEEGEMVEKEEWQEEVEEKEE